MAEILLDKEAEKNLTKSSGVVIRLENILSSKKLEKAINLSRDLAEYYLHNFEERLKILYEKYFKLENLNDKEELEKYNQLINLTKEDFTNLTYSDKLKLYRAYDYANKNNFGPNEIYDRGIFIDESYTLDEAVNDKDIMATIQAKIPVICKGPQKLELTKKIEKISKVAEQLKLCTETKVCFAVNRDFLIKNYSRIKNILTEFRFTNRIEIELVIDDDGFVEVDNDFDFRVPYSYTQKEMDKFGNLVYSNLVDKLYFSEFFQEPMIPTNRENLWTYYDIYKANLNNKNIINKIKKADLSPFEAIFFTNRMVTQSNYSGHATNDEKTRTFLTSEAAKIDSEKLEQSGKAFVCTGFASYAKAIVDGYANPNLQCMFVPVNFLYKKSNQKKFGATHMMLLVKIKDEKYDLDGYYIWDPTWSISSSEMVLCPVEDIKHYKKYIADIDHRKISKILSFLTTNREVSGSKTKNTIFDEYANQSPPIKFKVMIKALNEMFNKLRESKINDEEIKNSTNEEIISKLITNTYKDLTIFSPENAKNKFYEECRDIFIKNNSKYKNWQENWIKYCEGLEYN